LKNKANAELGKLKARLPNEVAGNVVGSIESIGWQSATDGRSYW
jgi:hypothetical protein